MRVVMQGSTSVGANTYDGNVLSAERYQQPPFNALGTLYVNGSATGLLAELNVGGISITPPVKVNAQNRSPVVPDDVLVSDWECLEGKNIQLTVTNTTGGALTAFWRVELEAVEIQ